MGKTKKFSNKLIVILFVLIALLMVSSLFVMRYLIRDVKKINGLSGNSYDRHFAFIHTGGDENFWEDVYQGARTKGEEIGVFVEDFGESLTVDYDANELLEIAIDASVDGLIIDGDYDEHTVELINLASEEGIPVVTVMNDCPGSDRICYVGISSYAMGRQYGERIIKHLNEAPEETMVVNVIMNTSHSESGSALVVSGILDVFTEFGFGDSIDIEGVYIDNETAFSAEENIRDIFLKGDLPDAIVGLNSVNTRCLFQAAVDHNKVGDVYIYGFDNSVDILDAVSKNIVEATVAVNTREMGSSSVEAIVEYLNTGYVSEYLAQDTELITADEAIKILDEDEE